MRAGAQPIRPFAYVLFGQVDLFSEASYSFFLSHEASSPDLLLKVTGWMPISHCREDLSWIRAATGMERPARAVGLSSVVVRSVSSSSLVSSSL